MNQKHYTLAADIAAELDRLNRRDDFIVAWKTAQEANEKRQAARDQEAFDESVQRLKRLTKTGAINVSINVEVVK